MEFIKNIPGTETDKELITSFKKSGDINYLSKLYQPYMELVFGVCLKYFKNIEQSKDAVMEIFQELHIKVKQYEIDNFRGWLYTLARNHCLMQLRSIKNMKITEFNPDFMQSEKNMHLNDEAFDKEENLMLLEECIKTLPEEQKKSIELFYLQNKCYNEIAEITGFDWNKVKSYIQNGRRNLKLCMEEKNGLTEYKQKEVYNNTNINE